MINTSSRFGQVIRRLPVLATLVLMVLLSFPQVAMATGGGATAVEMNKDVDGIRVVLVLPKGHAVTGINELEIRLHDAKDTPIEGATVKVTSQMEPSGMAMEKLAPKTVRLDTGTEKGEYVGKVDLTDAGKWILMTSFEVSGLEKEVNFDVEVEGTSRNWLVLGGFVGVLALVVAVAAVSKSRKAARAREE